MSEGIVLTQWKTCRVCGSSMSDALSLGNQHVVGFLDNLDESPLIAPLTLALCWRCNLLQLRTTVDPDLMFRHFWYRSGINERMREALKEIAQKAEHIAGLVSGEAVLDIGCNEGTLLGSYSVPVTRAGIDPAENIEPAVADVDFFIRGYFGTEEISERLLRDTGKLFKVITAIAMFYDVNDPITFLQQCKELLDPKGVIIIQMNYLVTMLEQNAFDNISHEHSCYYSLQSLKFITDRLGLDIVDVATNNVNGGSIRVYLSHQDEVPAGLTNEEYKEGFVRVSKQLDLEASAQLGATSTYYAFEFRINNICKILEAALATRLDSTPVFVYGASTRGSTLLQTAKLSHMLICAAERDERKYGRLTAGTGIRIFPEDVCRRLSKCFLMLPWHFKDAIFEREKEWGKAGGQFIVPLPWPTLYSWEENSQKWEGAEL